MSEEPFHRNCGILIVDDDEELVGTMAKLLRQHYPCVYLALSGAEAAALLAREECIRLVLVDLVMPMMDGLSVLDHVRQLHPGVSVILMTGFGSIETAVDAIKRGAEDFITKPFDTATLLAKVSRLMEFYDLKEQMARQDRQTEGESPFDGMIAHSPAMRRVLERAGVAAQSTAPILLMGETGVGKEMLARAIHRASRRAEKPFVPVNCAALPYELFESEMFGYRKGAFTGAAADRVGLFQAADEGTLFLDEIAEMPSSAQAKLLRVLEEGEVRPVGDTVAQRVNVRLVSATNHPLEKLGESLRDDLFFRISTVVIEIPPLRERREDLCVLAGHFLKQYALRYGRSITLQRSALNRLDGYPFPGNVRELAHILESAVALSTDDPQSIAGRDLLPLLRSGPAEAASPSPVTADFSLEGMEKFAIRQAMRLADNNKSRAAELLGISRGSLYRKLREYGLERAPEDSRPEPSAP